MMNEFDHLLAGVIVLVSLVQAFADPETLKGLPRHVFYKAGAITGLVGGALVLLIWHLAGRPVTGLGLFGWFGERPALVVFAAAGWFLLLLLALHLLLGRWRATAKRYYRGYGHLMPSTRSELAPAFAAGSLAGIGEELAYRGFLIWYLAAFLGLPGAVVLSSVTFGVAHGYLGRSGMLFATVAGFVFAGAYLLTGSLLLLLWMHASYNVASFTLGYRLLFALRSVGD